MNDLRRKGAFIAICALALCIVVAVAMDELGFAGRPWFGWWDANITIAAPFVLNVAPNAHGAAARSGLQNGDRIDLRKQTLAARVAVTYQLMGTQPTILTIDRGAATQRLAAVGGSLWENASPVKLDAALSRAAAGCVFVVCALSIALRRPESPRARAIAIALLCAVGTLLDPSFMVVPQTGLSLLLLLIARLCAAIAAVALIRASCSPRVLAASALGAVALGFAADLAALVGLMMVRIDPLPFILSLSVWRSVADVAIWTLVVLACLRARAVRPLAAAFLVSAICFASPSFVHAWLANMVVIAIANVALPLGAMLATWAVLKRRVATYGFAATCAVVVLLVSTQALASPGAVDHQHDFDFEFGAWTATLKMQPAPLTSSKVWVTYTGTSVVHRLWDGRGNYGELELGNAQSHIEGLTLRLYDPKAKMWNIYFADSKSGQLDATPMVGRFDRNRGVFYNTEPYAGKTVRVRFVFADITTTTFTFTQSFSADNGKTWVPNWIATFSRSRGE